PGASAVHHSISSMTRAGWQASRSAASTYNAAPPPHHGKSGLPPGFDRRPSDNGAVRAMALNSPGAGRVEAVERPVPHASPGQLLIHVRACGVCRTDLHVVDGDLPNVPIPIVPGHEIVGVVDAMGEGVSDFARGDRIGIPWL